VRLGWIKHRKGNGTVDRWTVCLGTAVGLLVLADCPAARASCVAPPHLRAAIQTKPTAEGYSALGKWYADRRQFDCAADAFAAAFRMAPTSARLAYLWGLSLFSAGRQEASLAPLGQAAGLDPHDVEPRLVLGEALEQMKKTDDADADWRAVLTIDPRSKMARESLAQDLMNQKDYAGVVALLEGGGDEAASPTQYLDLGTALAGLGRFADAAEELRRGVTAYPDSMPNADELATVLMVLARVDDAYAVLDDALKRHPEDQQTQLLYLRILVARRSDKAQALAAKLLQQSPDQWEVLYLNGLLESENGNLKAARAHLERSIASNAGYGESRAALGNLLAQVGDLAGARRNLEKAIALGDNEPEVQFDLARVYERVGMSEQAKERIAIYQQIKKAQSDRAQAAGEVESGDQAMTVGDATRAAALYKQAAEAKVFPDADQARVYYKLGMALDKSKDIDGEESALTEAIRLNGDFAEAQNQLGYLAIRGGNAMRAEGFFRAAVRTSPRFVVAWVNLAAALTEDGKLNEARAALGRALALDPDNRPARDLSQLIDQQAAH
jgi:tetratricopeptide (TPR) repeat protein